MAKKIKAIKNRVIKGQPHKLAYINDAEEGLLMSLGGSGEIVDGIPAFPPNEKDSLGNEKAGGGFEGGGGKDDRDAAADRMIADEIANREALQEKIGGISGGQAKAMFGDATMAGKGFTSGDIDRMLGSASVSKAALSGMLPELQRRARRAEQIKSLGGLLSPASAVLGGLLDSFGLKRGTPRTAYDDLAELISMDTSTVRAGGFFEPDVVLSATTGGTGAFGTPANVAQGYFGNIAYTGMPNPDYTGSFANLVNGYQGTDRDGDGQDVVPTQTNPLTGEQRCPDGYIFDADLQACRLDTGASTGGDGDTMGSSAEGLMYRPTALDEAPAFGGDGFAEANKAFVDTFAYNPDYYKNQMDLTGFVPTSGLLS